MKKILLSALLASTALLTLTASATVLDFEDLAGTPYYTPLPQNYGGITWAGNFWAYDAPQDPYTAHSGKVRIASNGGAGDYSFSFAAPTTFDGAWFAGSGDVSFSLFSGGSLVYTTATLGLDSTPAFLSTAGYAGLVDRVVVTGDRGFYVFDDLQFGEATAAVPEPATLALLGFGLAGLATTRRKSMKK